MKTKLCVIVGACLLTASMTWVMAKWTYQPKDNKPPLNWWKFACITIGIIWIMKIVQDCFRWMIMKLRILESIQNTNFHLQRRETNDNTEVPKRGFSRSLDAPRRRAMAANGK